MNRLRISIEFVQTSNEASAQQALHELCTVSEGAKFHRHE